MLEAKNGQDIVLIVTAHPDDEAMFFGPTIQQLLHHQDDVHLLCLSTGNAGGLGALRRVELMKSCAMLGIHKENVIVRDDPALQDGMSTQWDTGLVAAYIADAISTVAATVVISFDTHGVSGHTNHRAVHHGLRQILLERRNSEHSPEAWQLVSTGVLRKFLGILDGPLSVYEGAASPGNMVCYRAVSPLRIVKAMAKHHSQWVWFRKLFVFFSRYTYANTLQRLAV